MRKLKLLLLLTLLMTVGGGSSWAQSWTGNEPAEGTFLLYNVGAGKFINNGDPKQEWGTNAYLQAGFGLDIKFELNNGAYNLNTNVSNGGNSNYLATSTWCDGGATPWTFTAVDGQTNTYTISNSGSYLVANNELDDIVYGASTGDNKSWWKLVSLQDFKNAMIAKEYSTTESMDVSVFIKGRSFARNDGRNSSWTTTHNGGNWVWIGASANKYYGNESWNNTFSVQQTINNLPNGVYEVQCSGFGTNGTTYIFGNTTSKAIQSDNTTGRGTSKEAKWTAIHEDNAFAGQTTGTFLVKDGTITLGLKRETNNGGDWAIWDEFRLYYYGLDLSAYETEIASLRTTLNGLKDETMNATVKTTVNTVLSNTESITRTEKAMLQAISDLENAISSANASIAVYATVKTYLDKVATLDAAGQAAFVADETAGSIKTAYEALTLETLSAEQTTALEAALIAAALSQSTEGADMTLGLVNPSFENNFTGWTNSGMATQSNTSFGKTGNIYVESWEPNGTKSVKQSVTLLKSGVYTISANTKARGVTSAKLFAAGINKAATVEDAEHVLTVQFAADANQVVEFGFEGVGTGAGSSWLCVDNFQLTYVGGLPDITAVDGKMNADVASAQTTAIETYNANRTVANYNAAQAAIAAAEASKAAYAKASAAIADANALKTAHNFASATATTTFAEAIAAIENAYNDNSLTDNAANNAGLTLGVTASGWHGNANGAAVKYMNDGFSLNDFDQALYVNTWSNEGENDGSNFKVPFYEYWVADANSLAENTWTGTLTGLDNGLYSVSALVRVRAKNGVAATDATGITMDVNGNGEGEYAAVDVTEGEQIGESQFQYATYTAKGLVKDGNLTLNFNVADGNNVSWLCFKNVKYTKVRDLTPEEEAIAPTAIALKVGDDEVTEPIALNATNNTVTLTVNYTPAEATEGVTWVSSDETVATVANGVVTGVTPGTAIITATSTLDEEVKASATVTVTYPESEVPATYYVNDGATRTVYTLGENLVKNGSFEYPNPVYGWTTGTGSVNAMSTSNFNVPTTGAANGNQYLQATGSKGGADAKSINTSWPLEDGKTYVFSYKIKANQQCTTDLQYIGTSLSNTKGSENGNKKFDTPAYGTEWQTVTYTFTNTDNYKWLVFNARWMANAQSFDNVYLCEAAYTLEGNVDYATAAIPTANIGTGAFQYSQAAIDAANNLVQGTATVEDVQNAYDALTTINEPSNGQLFNVILTYSGWTYDQKAMTYLANARNDGGYYNIQYKEAANKNLAQAFTFTKVSGNNYKMSQIDADGNDRYISTGVPYGGNTGQIRTTTDVSKALVVTVIPTATEGKWNLRNTEASQFIGSQDAGVFTVNSHIDFNIVETTKPSIEINTTAAGWGTVMLPFAQELPAEVKAYTCNATEDDRLTLTEVDALEANKPYLIEGAWNQTVTGDAQGIALTYTDGLFTGVYADQDAPVGNYVLQNKKEKLGFYRVAEGKQPTVGSNHAYLTVPASARDAFFFGEGETTAISMLKALSEGTVEIYNLNGVKQSKLQKGTNILKMSDGSIRKVMVK